MGQAAQVVGGVMIAAGVISATNNGTLGTTIIVVAVLVMLFGFGSGEKGPDEQGPTARGDGEERRPRRGVARPRRNPGRTQPAQAAQQEAKPEGQREGAPAAAAEDEAPPLT